MKKILLFLLLAIFSLGGVAQERTTIKVLSVDSLKDDTHAVRYGPRDKEGNSRGYAYVRIMAPRTEDMKFTIKGKAPDPAPTYNAGEWGVYVPQNFKEIVFLHERYGGGTIDLHEPAKKHKVYKVVLDVPLLEDSYDDLLVMAKDLYNNYKNHTESSYYDKARIAYDKLMAHEKCPQNLLEVFRCERDTMASIRKYTYFAEETEKRANKAEREKGFVSEEVYKNLSGEYTFLHRLATYHPEVKGFADKKEKVWERLSKHPKAKETVKEVETVHRQVIAGKVKKSNAYDTRPLNSLHVNVSTQYDVSKKDAREAAKQIGNVAADGTFSVVIPDGYTYLFIDGEKHAHRIVSGMTTIEIII